MQIRMIIHLVKWISDAFPFHWDFIKSLNKRTKHRSSLNMLLPGGDYKILQFLTKSSRELADYQRQLIESHYLVCPFWATVET